LHADAQHPEVWARVDRGHAYDLMQDYQSALIDYDMAINLAPTDSIAITERGITWAHRGQRLLALSDYSLALHLDGNPEARRQIEAMEAGPVTVPPNAAYAEEDRDFNVPEQLTLYPYQDIAHETPIAIPVATTLTTRQVATKLNGDDRFILIQALNSEQRLPGAVRLGIAGSEGSYTDIWQKLIQAALLPYTNGDLDRPLVVYCQSVRCRESYNAVLRLRAIGYRSLFWYRGGLDAWKAAGLPVVTD
jgi:rhodanese-related sulfurtransferase